MQHIAARIHLIKEWADAHKARVICGEFGVLRNHIDPASRYRWIADTRKSLEAYGIPWELWDYTDLYGIARLVGQVSRRRSVRRLDPAGGPGKRLAGDRARRHRRDRAANAMTTEPGRASYAYLPTLDGFRALSILLVVFSHAGLGQWIPGGLGVVVFF